MNSEAFKSSVGRCAFIGKFSILVLTLFLGLLPQQATAAGAGNAQFYQYIYNICNTAPAVILDPVKYGNVCAAFSGYVTNGGINSVNLGTANAASGLASHKKSIRELADEQKDKAEKGASADGGDGVSWCHPSTGIAIVRKPTLKMVINLK